MQQPGWAGAQRPAKLDTAGTFERIFALYRDQATLLLPAALILFLPLAIVEGILRTSGNALLALIALVLSLVGTFWFQGMVVEAVADMRDGRRDFTVGSLFRSTSPFIWPLAAAGILAGIGILIGFVLLVVPGLILLTMWALISPVIVVERAPVTAAFSRSSALTKGTRWQVFGVIVVLFLIQAVLSSVLTAIASGISHSVVGYTIGVLLSQVIVAPLGALAAGVMYFALRDLKEGGGIAPPGAAQGVAPPGVPPQGGAPPHGVPQQGGVPQPGGAPPPGTPPPPGWETRPPG